MTTYLLTGDDESILRNAVVELIDHLVGDGDRSMMVDEFDGDDYELRAVVDAAQTSPFLSDKRVVIARSLWRFAADEVGPMVAYVGNPLDTTELVLVASTAPQGKPRVAKKLADAVKANGKVTSTSPPTRAKDVQAWVAEHVASAGVRVKPDAAAQLAQWLGEDVGRLDGILATLRSTYGTDHVVTVADLQPFLGDAGGVPPWDFTDAIDAGNTTKALTLLARMTNGGGRHPLQVMSILHNHYVGIAKLDGVDARSDQDAMAATGLKEFPAKKARLNYQRLGATSAKRAVELLAQADLDLRGARDLDPDVVMDVLVARLSKLRR